MTTINYNICLNKFVVGEGSAAASDIMKRLSQAQVAKAPGSLSDLRDRVQIVEEKMDWVQGNS